MTFFFSKGELCTLSVKHAASENIIVLLAGLLLEFICKILKCQIM